MKVVHLQVMHAYGHLGVVIEYQLPMNLQGVLV